MSTSFVIFVIIAAFVIATSNTEHKYLN